MTTAIIITVCTLILLAYIFDITSSKTKVPSVILLLLMGWLVKQISLSVGLSIPNLSPILPILGTIGLILIVLEGSLELELNASKFTLIKKSFAVALFPMLLLAFGIAGAFHYWDGTNYKEMKRFKWIQRLKPDLLDREVKKFKEITIEATFVIRVLFFLLFGYLMETAEILNTDTLLWAVGIVVNIFCLRAIFLKFYKMDLSPLLFVAPRGLITILLFLSIPASQTMPLVNKSLIIQIIILSALVMMVGLMIEKKKTTE